MAARILIPVWGEHYIRQFIDLSLPTLLAPGNIPAVATVLPTTIEFLTSGQDTARLLAAPAIRRLETFCRVSVRTIDDLIVPGLHPLTITVAYTRAIRALGTAAEQTCFFLLVSDYVMADGSLAHVLSLMLAGRSVVQAGNFRMIDTAWPAPSALPYADGVLRLTPRELARMAMAQLHPKTVANIVDSSLCRNEDCNQLFWRAGPDTLVGKFFLLHPICVRPERSDFVAGGFVDYAFAPEMSAPGNVTTITDSDDYLVIELQAAEHEAETLRGSPLTVRQLADRLSEWTTAHHRRNADATIVYHAGDRPPELQAVMSEAEEFLARLRSQVSAAAHPSRGHPYWYGMLARYARLVGRTPVDLVGPDLPPDIASLGVRGRWVLIRQWGRRVLVGDYPVVGIASPCWPDLVRPVRALAELCNDPDRTFLTAGAPPELNGWIARRCHCRWLLDDGGQANGTGRLADRETAAAKVDAGLLYLADGAANAAPGYLAGLLAAVRPGGRLFILMLNDRKGAIGTPLAERFAELLPELTSRGAGIDVVSCVPSTRMRQRITCAMESPGRDALSMARRARIPARLRACCLLLLSIAVNLWTALRCGAKPSRRGTSSIFIVARAASTPQA